MAFTLARLRQSQGRLADAREFARQARAHSGSAVLIQAQIDAFLQQSA
jgi:hypothetical protein